MGRTKRREVAVEVGRGERLVDRVAVGHALLHADAAREVGLGIDVHEQDVPLRQGERRGQVDGGRGLAHAALLVGYGYYPAHFQQLTGLRHPSVGDGRERIVALEVGDTRKSEMLVSRGYT